MLVIENRGPKANSAAPEFIKDVVAPCSGVIQKMHVKEDQFITTGATLFEIEELDLPALPGKTDSLRLLPPKAFPREQGEKPDITTAAAAVEEPGFTRKEWSKPFSPMR